jgi:hypothetical protein
MKNVTYGLFALVLSLFIIQGCQKSDLIGQNGQLTATKLTLKLNETDTLTLVGASADSIQWSVTPAGSGTLLKFKNYAIVKFNKAGTYTINATVSGGATSTISLTVTNDAYVPNPIYTVYPFNNEQISLTPVYYKSKKGDTSYMYFRATTAKTYPCNNSILLFTKSVDVASKNLGLNFIGEKRPDVGNCGITGSTLTSSSIYYFYEGTALSFIPGTYTFTVTLSDTTYTGSIVISATDININWDYTSGVIITNKHINR